MRRLLSVVLVISFSQAVYCGIQTVTVTGGTVQGTNADNIAIFKGIPFAAPPVGDLRWRPPAPVAAWEGVKQADAFGQACMQAEGSMGNTAPVSEDCLSLNVWTPASNANEKKPVIVWIHGGGFSGGSTSTPMYDGTGFAKKGTVFVSLAYRLGPYGFLAHPELSKETGRGSGSFGLEDMVVGLQWVEKNISQFGGDPANVTIFGHSAGCGAVSMLVASPVTQGLFHRAICMSGGSFAPLQQVGENSPGMSIPSLATAEATGEALLGILGVADIKAARALGADRIQAAVTGGEGAMRFRPTADGYVVSRDLYSLYEAGKFNDMPILIGHASDETAAFGGPQTVTPEEFRNQIQSQYGAVAVDLLAAYPHATNEAAAKAARGVRNMSSFDWNTWAWANQQSRHGHGKVYNYYFDYHAPTVTGAGHGSDVPFAFQTLAGRRSEPTIADHELAGMISSYFVNFATSGDPNGPGLPEWPAFTGDKPVVMLFDAEPAAEAVPDLDKLKIFDRYMESLRKR